MKTLLEKIRSFEKSAEELANCAAMAAIGHKITLSVEDAHELMDRISWASVLGARAERSILEAAALQTAIEILKQKMQQVEK